VDVPRDYAADEETVSRLLHDLEQASVGGDHHAAKSLIGTLEVALTHLDTCRLERYVRSLARTPLPHYLPRGSMLRRGVALALCVGAWVAGELVDEACVCRLKLERCAT
jgi:hypothetical protein